MPGESRLTYLSVTNPSPGLTPLPRRTGRSLPPGRHRSPHRLTLPPDAPALVLAVPGAAGAASDELAEQIAATAGMSCSGAEVRVGYLEGRRIAWLTPWSSTNRSAQARLRGPWWSRCWPGRIRGSTRPWRIWSAGPKQSCCSPVTWARIRCSPRYCTSAWPRPGWPGRAGPAGSASSRPPTASWYSPTAATRPSTRPGSPPSCSRAGSPPRPCRPRSGDPREHRSALARLRDAGVSRAAIAPCVIGPETDPDELAAVGTATGAPCAGPLGAHPAIGQLVAMRYGAALAGLHLAGLPAERPCPPAERPAPG